MLHKKFQATLVNYLKLSEQRSEAGATGAAGAGPTQDELMHHAVTSWDAFLEDLTTDSKSRAVLMTLAGALQLTTGGTSKALTSQGFQFVLDERQQQLWSLILTFLKSRKDQALPLKIIFAIGELKLGQRLVCSASEPFLHVLQELGILYSNQGNFYVTPAGLALFNKDSSAILSRLTGSSDEDQGIIVESNFKVYCYTSHGSSGLHVKLLSYFCDILMELPKLVVAQLTADSVLKALKRGIRVANILRYLDAAAHPRSSVPSNVKGQLEAKENEKIF